MAAGRSKSVELVKLLHAAAQPLYLLAEGRRLVFCNQALLDWVGHSAEELLGKCCTYHSDPELTGAEAVVAGLCPPPEVLAGRETTGVVARTTPDGSVVRRRVRFIPLRGAGDTIAGLLALVETEDLAEVEAAWPTPEESEAAWLHERLRTHHRQMAAKLRSDRLVGESLTMRRIRAQAAVAAETRASVLILGPPGSGRQRIAGAIHYATEPAPAGSLVPLACAALSGDLIYSTIKALAFKKSWDETPSQNTLLLSDVDCLPVEVQMSLVELFSSKAWPMRLIATARQSLDEAVRMGKFRSELAVLLSTLVIQVPPLSVRREDVPLLAQMFLEQCNARGEKQLAGFTSEALDRLGAYHWPGNVDELAQIVGETHRRAEGSEVGVNDLPDRLHLAAAAEARPRRVEEKIVLDEYLGRIERELIERALSRAKGNKTKAARLLGMSRPRLYRRMVQLGLEEEEERTKDEGQRTKGEEERPIP
ncbi:MAG: helix-turn-helix domain-containing protein [Thermoguttaceae bacterium]